MSRKAAPIPDPPAHLSDRAKALWSEVVQPTDPPRRLAAIQAALEFLDRAEAARQEVEAKGLLVGQGTVPHLNPAVRVERESRTAFLKWWTWLGFHQRPTRIL